MHTRRKLRSECGASAVEFALVAPLLFLLVFGIIDFGFGFGASINISNAAREGARLAVVDADPVRVEAAVRRAAASLDQAALSVKVECTTSTAQPCPGGLAGGKAGDEVTVKVTYKYNVMTPVAAIIGNGLTLNASSAMRIE
jgi:Flp pilus assembly protein TadG